MPVQLHQCSYVPVLTHHISDWDLTNVVSTQVNQNDIRWRALRVCIGEQQVVFSELPAPVPDPENTPSVIPLPKGLDIALTSCPKGVYNKSTSIFF